MRDKLFERILSDKKDDAIAAALKTTPTRLLQQLELFIEGVSPSLAVFIDDTDQDLLDFCDALDIPTEIYRVKKFIVNGRPEYYSPDKNQPAVTFDTESNRQDGSTVFDVIEQLGGGEVVSGRNRCYRLQDGRVVKIQASKFHERHQAYWYGINPSSYEQSKGFGASHFVFVMGDEGFGVLPVGTVDKYLETAHITRNGDGSVRHFHLHLSAPPDVYLKGYGNAPDTDVSSSFQTLN